MTTQGPVRTLLSRRPDIELQFVRHRTTGRVHIAVPVDPDEEPVSVPFSQLSEQERFETFLGFIRQPMLCGYLARVYLDGKSDYQVSTFADTDLCWSCHRTLGPELQHRAFEHPQAEEQS